MSKWKCEICGSKFKSFHAQSFNNKIYCPLCYFKRKTELLVNENQKIKNVIKQIGFEPDEIAFLQQENAELNKQLKELRNRYKNKLEKLLSEYIDPDPEDFYLAEIEGKANDYDKLLIKQQRFIKYLEECEEAFTLNHDPINAGACKGILQKYKEIIGVSDENNKQ